MRTIRFAALAVAALFLSSCATTRPSPTTCAAIGAVLGGTGGAVGGAKSDEGSDWDAATGYGAAGAVVLGTAGYFICKALAKEEPPPPPKPAPPPPPPPKPKAEPKPDPCKEVVRLRGVNFDFDKSDIRPDAVPILEEALRQLKRCPSRRIHIEGHTDAIGSDNYNQGLSERRAQAVRDYFEGRGIAAGRLSTAGYGESQPIASNDTKDGRALNRRIELKPKQ